jgi:hypothetical protein
MPICHPEPFAIVTLSGTKGLNLRLRVDSLKDLKYIDTIRFFALLRMTECHKLTFYENTNFILFKKKKGSIIFKN